MAGLLRMAVLQCLAVAAQSASKADNTEGDGHMDARASRYHEVYARSMRDPEGFWGEAAQELDWYEPAKKVFDASQGIYGLSLIHI